MDSPRNEAWSLDLSIVIPAHNEAGVIGQVVVDFRTVCAMTPWIKNYEIIVVDDASGDLTRVLAEDCGARTYSHAARLGYGSAIKTGVLLAKYPWICIVDGDGTYPPYDLPRMLQALTDADMVVAQRFGWIAGNGMLHLLGRWVLLRVARTVSRQPIEDLNSGYRVFHKVFFMEVSESLSDGFSLSTGLTLLAHYLWERVVYVPVLYHKRQGRVSTVQRVRGFFRILGIIARMHWTYGRTRHTG